MSLVELLISVGLLTLIAAVALPTITREHSETSDDAAQVVASALRFAREQASLTGEVHGVEISAAANQLRVFRLEEAGRPLYTVRHPLTRQLYTLTFGVGIYRKVQLQELRMVASGACNSTSLLGFNSHGVTLCTNPLTTPVTGAVTVNVESYSTTISIDPVVGRVTFP